MFLGNAGSARRIGTRRPQLERRAIRAYQSTPYGAPKTELRTSTVDPGQLLPIASDSPIESNHDNVMHSGGQGSSRIAEFPPLAALPAGKLGVGEGHLLFTTRKCAELRDAILQARKLSDPNRGTSFKELMQLRQDALDALCLAGLDGTHFFEELKRLDFYDLVYQDQGAALAAEPSLHRRLEIYAEDVSTQKLPERIRNELFRRLERFVKVLELADRKKVQPQADRHQASSLTHAPERADRKGSAKASTLPKSRRRNRFALTSPTAHRAPAVRRARTIAKLLGELDALKPEMNAEQDYGRLAQTNKKFLCFRITRKHPGLRLKLENLQAHRQRVRLAQELAAAYHGVTLSTAQTDWKRHKPSSFRKH